MYTQLKQYFDAGPRITLPGVQEEIRLPDDTWFRYDGEVPSLTENMYQTQRAIQKMRLSGPGQPRDSFLDRLFGSIAEKFSKDAAMDKVNRLANDANTTALCTKHPIDERITAYVIALKQGLNPSKKIFAQGHESGELLQRLSQQETLQRFLEAEGVHLDISGFKGEDFADICGLLALKKAHDRDSLEVRLPVIETRANVLVALAPLFHF